MRDYKHGVHLQIPALTLVQEIVESQAIRFLHNGLNIAKHVNNGVLTTDCLNLALKIQ